MSLRRKRELRSKRKLLIRRLKAKPARASDYLYWLKNYRIEHPNLEVLLYNRESTDSQPHEKNENALRRGCKKRGIPIIGKLFCENLSGKPRKFEGRTALKRAVKTAKSLNKKGKHVAILAISSDRYLRNQYYTKYNQKALPTAYEYEKFIETFGGDVDFLTATHPNRHEGKNRSYHTTLGQTEAGNKGGRPILKRTGWTIKRRDKKLPRVRRLLEKGKNVTEISRKLQVARSTVDDWVKNYLQ